MCFVGYRARDLMLGFLWGFSVGVIAMWLSTFLRIPFWLNAIILLAAGIYSTAPRIVKSPRPPLSRRFDRQPARPAPEFDLSPVPSGTGDRPASGSSLRSMAEGVGFEPTVGITYNGFRDRPVQPLRHPSAHSVSHSHFRLNFRPGHLFRAVPETRVELRCSRCGARVHRLAEPARKAPAILPHSDPSVEPRAHRRHSSPPRAKPIRG